MFATQIISDIIKPIDYNATGEKALFLLHEFNINQIPVIENGNYIGLISFDEITLLKHLDEPLKNVHKTLQKPYVRASSHLFDVMKAAVEYNVRVVPVLANDSEEYLGLVTAESCLRAFAQLNSVLDEGAVLTIEIPHKDYQLSTIVRIVEENNAAIITLYTDINHETATVQLTLKLNTNEIQSIVNTFERYGYAINGLYQENEYTEDLKDRYDALLKYINL